VQQQLVSITKLNSTFTSASTSGAGMEEKGWRNTYRRPSQRKRWWARGDGARAHWTHGHRGKPAGGEGADAGAHRGKPLGEEAQTLEDTATSAGLLG
jgi:hypothetical protein